MKIYTLFFTGFLSALLLIISCAKVPVMPLHPPRLFITLKDSAGRSVDSALVRLYKNVSDPGIIKMSDTSGVVIFDDLQETNYYWFAEKGCQTNKNSQYTLNKAMIANATLYGYSVLTKTGTLIINNNDTLVYKVSDSLFSVTLNRDTTVIAYPRLGWHKIHSEKVGVTGTGKDTSIQVRCGDTCIINLPY